MRTLTTLSIRSRDGGRPTFLGFAVATGMLFGAMNGALAACPWIVQTHFDGDHQASEKTRVNIVFDGRDDQESHFYGFTVTDIDLAWDLSAPGDGTIIDLEPHGRALDVMETITGPAFEISPESIEPHTVYLVAARSPVEELDRLEAAIEPSRPFNVSYAKTRGATDVSGPLPVRSLPGIEIRASKEAHEVDQWLTSLQGRGLDVEPDLVEGFQPSAETTLAMNDIERAKTFEGQGDIRHDVQICAYQVAVR